MVDTGKTEIYSKSVFTLKIIQGTVRGAAVYTCRQCPGAVLEVSAVSRGHQEKGLTLGVSRNLPEDATSKLSSINIFIFKSFI